MNSFFNLNALSLILPLLAVLLTLYNLYTKAYQFHLGHNIINKNRIIDLANTENKKLPLSAKTRSALRSAIYDYCKREYVSLKLAIICLNSNTPGLSLECYRHAGFLYSYCPESRSWKYTKNSKKIYENKHRLSATYFLLSFISLSLATINSIYNPNSLESTMSILSIFTPLIIFTIHSYRMAEKHTRILVSIKHFEEVLAIPLKK